MHNLEHPLGTGEIGKAMLPQIKELDRRLTRELTRRQRQHDLPAVPVAMRRAARFTALP